MQATISVKQQLTGENVEIIVCHSLLAALTAGKSLCGALTELFEVCVSAVGSCVARACMLINICGASPKILGVSDGMV